MRAHSSSPRSHVRSWLRALFALPLVLAAGPAARAIPLDPNAYVSLGSLAGASGTFTFNTSRLLASGVLRTADGGVLFAGGAGSLQSQAGGPDIAVFTFDDIDLGADVNINITGDRPVAILSRGNAIFQSALSVSDGGAAGRAGGGAGGSAAQGSAVPTRGSGTGGGGPAGKSLIGSYTSAGGGGFGGPGGAGATYVLFGAGTGGLPYGEDTGVLQGGSGGGGVFSAPGGAGGGALQIGALGSLQVSSVFAAGSSAIGGGGSGGMIELRGTEVRVAPAGILDASGGDTIRFFVDPVLFSPIASGGGGGGRVVVAVRDFAWGVDSPPNVDVEGGVVPSAAQGQPSGNASGAGTFVLRADTVSFGAGQVLALSGAPLMLPGTNRSLEFDALRIDTGGLAFAATAFAFTKDLKMNGGLVAAAAGLTLTDGRTLSGFGTVSGPLRTEAGSFVVAQGGTLSLGDPSIAQGLRSGGFISVERDSTLILNSADRITLGPDTKLFTRGRLVSINGIEVAAGTTLESFGPATIDGTVRNQGKIEGPTVEDQALVFLDDVDGAGEFTGNVVFRGGFSPGNSPAVVSMENVTLDPTAVLSIEIAGREAGQFDQLVVSGHALLGGTLHLSFIDGFDAQAGDSFAFIVGGTVTGTFAHVDVTGLDPSLRYAIGYSANGVRFDVQAVPEPQTWALLGLGLAVVGAAGGRARRAVA